MKAIPHISHTTIPCFVIAFVILLSFITPASAVFSDDFETGDFSKWTSSNCVIIQTDKGNSSNCYNWRHASTNIVLNNGSDFTLNADIQINSTEYTFLFVLSDIWSGQILDIYFDSAESGFMCYGEGSCIAVDYYDSNWNYIEIHEPYEIRNTIDGNNWTHVNVERVGNNLAVKVNNNLIKTFIMINPQIQINDLRIFEIYGFGESDVFDNINVDNYSYPTAASCSFIDFSICNFFDIGCYLRAILNWLYSAPACYLAPIWDFFANIIDVSTSSMLWVLNLAYDLSLFIIGIIALFASVIQLITGLFLDIFAVNAYAALTFSIILMGFSLVFFMRIYNIIADIEIFGWKLPKL